MYSKLHLTDEWIRDVRNLPFKMDESSVFESRIDTGIVGVRTIKHGLLRLQVLIHMSVGTPLSTECLFPLPGDVDAR